MVTRNDEVRLRETRVPKDESAEKKVCRNRRENVLVLEKRWSHGCCHISFPKSCYDGKHAKVSGVSRWVEVKKMTRVILRISRTDNREWRWKTVSATIVPVR